MAYPLTLVCQVVRFGQAVFAGNVIQGLARLELHVIGAHVILDAFVFGLGLNVQLGKPGHVSIDVAPCIALPQCSVH